MTSSEPERPALTITEAAKAAGVDRRTIRRYLDRKPDTAFPNAYREDGKDGPATGAWRIPVTDLLGAGLALNAPRLEPTVDVVEAPPARDELLELRGQLEDERARRQLAEALAQERHEQIERLDRIVADLIRRVPELEPGPPVPMAHDDPRRAEIERYAREHAAAVAPKRRRWFRRS